MTHLFPMEDSLLLSLLALLLRMHPQYHQELHSIIYCGVNPAILRHVPTQYFSPLLLQVLLTSQVAMTTLLLTSHLTMTIPLSETITLLYKYNCMYHLVYLLYDK